MTFTNRYVCYYAQEFNTFRLEELESIISIYKLNVKISKDSYDEKKPYLTLEASLDDVTKILSRSVLIKSITQVWSFGNDIKEAGDVKFDLPDKIQHEFPNPGVTFKIEVESFNNKMSMPERVEYIEEIQKFVAIPGKINLKTPDVILSLLLSFEKEQGKEKEKGKLGQVYFGKVVGSSQRSIINKYSLKTRYFIGNTSMDPQLSFLMATQAEVTPGSWCYDPFVGTGSILIGCGHFGGMCSGNDIDYNVVYGKGKTSRVNTKQKFKQKDELVRTNFESYDLHSQYLDIMAGDATHLPIRVNEIFDAVVTDPPYGIREGGRKIGSKKEDECWDIPSEVRDEHIPAKRIHTLPDVITDLLTFAFTYLKVGGKLVYFLPIFKPTFTQEQIPGHPGLCLSHQSEQKLSNNVARLLITMIKVKSIKEVESLDVDSNTNAWRAQQNDFRKNYFNLESSLNGM